MTDGPACLRSHGNVTMQSGILRIDAPQYAGRETVGVGHVPRRTGRRDRTAVEQGPAGNASDGGGFIARTMPGGCWQSRNGLGGTAGGAYGSMVSGMTRRRVAETFRSPRPDCRYGPGFQTAITPDGFDPVVPAAPGVPAGSTGSTKATFSQGRCCPGSHPNPGKAVNSVLRPGILLDLPHRRDALTGRRGTNSTQGDPGARSGCRDPVPGEDQKPDQDGQGTGQMQRKGGVITMFGKKSTVISMTYRGGHYEST